MRAGQSTGITLIELVVVLAVLTVALGFALPAVGRGAVSLQLRADGSRVAGLLREARRQAVAERRATRVSLDRSRTTLHLGFPDDPEPRRRLDLSAGMHLEVAEGRDALTFSPRGITQDARWVVEAAGGRRLLVDVQGVTGRVTVGGRRQ